MTEAQNQRDIFESQSNRKQKLFRNTTGFDKQRKIHYGIPRKGGSDLLGWTVINGVAVFTGIEVKTATGRPTREQQWFIDAVRRDGGIAGVCRTCEDVERLIDEWIAIQKSR